MPYIVQFTHPSGEHGPDKGNPEFRSWNTGSHKRKFLLSSGTYIDKNGPHKDELLVFWGEWEPPSAVSKLTQPEKSVWKITGKEECPKWLHRPIVPEVTPKSSGYQQSYQNTDPFVFENPFKYFVCKQYKPKNLQITPLSFLDKGSLILFGSTKGKEKDSSYFMLDTVFVVSDYIDYNPQHTHRVQDGRISKMYHEVVYKMAFPSLTGYSLNLRLYFGATYEAKIHDMYSYSPSMLYNKDNYGFPRVVLKDIEYITNNLNSAPNLQKKRNFSLEEVHMFWVKIREISRNHGCVEGVKFDLK